MSTPKSFPLLLYRPPFLLQTDLWLLCVGFCSWFYHPLRKRIFLFFLSGCVNYVGGKLIGGRRLKKKKGDFLGWNGSSALVSIPEVCLFQHSTLPNNQFGTPNQQRSLNKFRLSLPKVFPSLLEQNLDQILLISADWAYNLVPNMYYSTKMYARCKYIPTELPFCIPPLLVGYAL